MMTDETQGMGMSSNEICVPTSSLSKADENDQMQTPEVGDKVQVMVDGTVSRVEGENAYVTMTAANGEDIESKAPAAPDEDAELTEMAANMPEKGY